MSSFPTFNEESEIDVLRCKDNDYIYPYPDSPDPWLAENAYPQSFERGSKSAIASYHEKMNEQLWRALASAADQLEIAPKKLGGITVFKGTRYSLSQFFAELADSDAIDEIADEMSLNADQLRKCLHAFSLYYDRPLLR